MDFNPDVVLVEDKNDSVHFLPPGFNIHPPYSNPAIANNPLFFNLPNSSTHSRKSLPVSQWPIKYAGNDNGIGLNLLRKVEIFAHSEKMTKEELFESAHFLLVGPAQDWFVANLHNKNWDYFIQALRHQFLPMSMLIIM